VAAEEGNNNMVSSEHPVASREGSHIPTCA